MIGNQKVENIMLLVNAYKEEPSVGNYNAVYEAIDNALSRHPATLEPLEDLAKRKGVAFRMFVNSKDNGVYLRDPGDDLERIYEYEEETLDASKAKARTWLEGQEDKK